MGYTVTAPCIDDVAKNQMMAVLNAHYRKWPLVQGRPIENSFARGPLDNDLSYDYKPCRIGFDFNCFEGERNYIFTLLKWVALKVGKPFQYPLGKFTDVVGIYPAIVYDGDDGENPEDGEGEGPWPVILDEGQSFERSDWCLVDRWGCRTRRSKKATYVEEQYMENLKLIRPEIIRLDKIWDAKALL